jgi:alcohol dehydrogenase (NADP+)
MLCAGLTAFSPLVRNGCGPGKKVGIVGMGGIGHFGIMFAKALGAETWAISRSHAKEADSKELGADGFIATEDKDWNVPHKLSFDLIINTANSTEGFDLERYLSLLDVHGRWISVGLPEGAGQEVKTTTFLSNGCLIGASHLGSRKEMIQMLQLAADKGLKSWVEEIPISEKGLTEAGKLFAALHSWLHKRQTHSSSLHTDELTASRSNTVEEERCKIPLHHGWI